jgi:hypothetical protein
MSGRLIAPCGLDDRLLSQALRSRSCGRLQDERMLAWCHGRTSKHRYALLQAIR